jgi:hypothetical protein
MRSLLALLLLASCAKGGVEFVIATKGSNVDRVVLFVGVGDAYDEAILPMGRAAPYPKSSAWARDHGNELDERKVTNPDEPVVFQFQGDGKLGVVIAIGVAGEQAVSAAVVRGIAVPSESIARYELTLEPVNTTASPLELTAWESTAGSPAAGKQCVALFDKRTMSADAVVTEGDPDCDGWPSDDPKECQDNLYMSFGRPGLEEAACLAGERVALPDGTVSDGCVLGGPPCADGLGQAAGCSAATPYCVPKSLCNRCLGKPDDWNCARDVSALVMPYPTHLRCKLSFDGNGQPCSAPFKAIANPPMNIGGHFCKPDVQPVLITTAGGTWGSSVDFVAETAALHVDVKNLEPSCNFELQVSGTIQGPAMFGGLVAGMLDNGRGLAYPIVFEVDPLNLGCAFQTACQATWSWDLSELVDQCVNTPVFPP